MWQQLMMRKGATLRIVTCLAPGKESNNVITMHACACAYATPTPADLRHGDRAG